MNTGRDAAPEQPTPELILPEGAFEEVMADYYKGVFGLADTARGRSQAAWAIASAIAAALVTAGLVKNFAAAPAPVQAVGIAAVFAWLATGAIFMWALVKPLPERPQAPEGRNQDQVKLAFVRNALSFYRTDLEGVQYRQRVALTATSFAALITVAAISVNVSVSKPVDTAPATVALSDAGQKQVQLLCGNPARTLTGSLETSTLSEANVVLRVSATQCPAARKTASATKGITLVLPRHDVAGLESNRLTIPM